MLITFSQNMLRKMSATSEITSRRGAEIKRLIKEIFLTYSEYDAVCSLDPQNIVPYCSALNFRDLKEVKKKPLAVDSRYASSKITESHVGPPKSR